MEELSLTDYFSILKRRKNVFLLVACVVLLVSLIVTATWSNYRASATVEIAQAEIDESAASEEGTGQPIADLRVSRLQQKVLSNRSLIEIIRKFSLYGSPNETVPVALLSEKMRKKIKIDLISSKLASPSSANKISASQLSAIAFILSFDYSDPLIAQQVANELVERFLDEDIADRQKQAQDTTVFLDKQLKILEASLTEQEKAIADFRAANGDVRPELLAFNQQAIASTLMSLQNIESQINTNLGTQGALRAQLAATSAYSRTMADGQILTTPAIQLKALESEYATMTAKYGPEHPDLIKTRRQIAALKPLVESEKTTAPLQAKIEDTKARLETMGETNGAEHPDVKALTTQLASYEEQLAALAGAVDDDFIKKDADNPAYLQIVTQLQTAKEQLVGLQRQKETLEAEQEKYRRAVAENPNVEQKLAALTRNYDNTNERYRALKEKKLQAEMNETIENESAGARLVLANPAELPLDTHPSRKIFFLLGLMASVGIGFVTSFGLQLLSQSVIGPRQLAAIAGTEPFVCVPHCAKNGAPQENRFKGILHG